MLVSTKCKNLENPPSQVKKCKCTLDDRQEGGGGRVREGRQNIHGTYCTITIIAYISAVHLYDHFTALGGYLQESLTMKTSVHSTNKTIVLPYRNWFYPGKPSLWCPWIVGLPFTFNLLGLLRSLLGISFKK